MIFHFHSADNAVFSLKIANSSHHCAAVERGYPKNGSASRMDLEKFAKANKLTIEKISPITFFHPKALFYRAGLDKGERLAFATEVDRRLSVPEAYEFARWFEAEVVGCMPVGFTADLMELLRKC